MPYTKPALTFAQQADLLIQRGLIADKYELAKYLSRVNYYRLSGYLYPFKKAEDRDDFAEGTSLGTIQERYSFDSRLRLQILSAIEIIEIAVLRTQLVEQLSTRYGPFWYADKSNFKNTPHYPEDFHEKLMVFLEDTLNNSASTDFIARYKAHYPDEERIPFWMLVEKMTFGQLNLLITNMHREDRITLAKKYSLSYKVLASWLHSLTFVRNACAHHERLWNRYIPIRPKIPDEKNVPGFHQPIKIAATNTRIFPLLVVIQYMLNFIDPNNNWGEGLKLLIEENPELPIGEIGFPENWTKVPYWKQ